MQVSLASYRKSSVVTWLKHFSASGLWLLSLLKYVDGFLNERHEICLFCANPSHWNVCEHVDNYLHITHLHQKRSCWGAKNRSNSIKDRIQYFNFCSKLCKILFSHSTLRGIAKIYHHPPRTYYTFIFISWYIINIFCYFPHESEINSNDIHFHGYFFVENAVLLSVSLRKGKYFHTWSGFKFKILSIFEALLSTNPIKIQHSFSLSLITLTSRTSCAIHPELRQLMGIQPSIQLFTPIKYCVYSVEKAC